MPGMVSVVLLLKFAWPCNPIFTLFWKMPCTAVKFTYNEPRSKTRWDVRVAEGARLESVYTVIPYRGFESPSDRHYESSIKMLFSFMGSLFFSQLLGVPCFPQQLNGLVVHCSSFFWAIHVRLPYFVLLSSACPKANSQVIANVHAA